MSIAGHKYNLPIFPLSYIHTVQTSIKKLQNKHKEEISHCLKDSLYYENQRSFICWNYKTEDCLGPWYKHLSISKFKICLCPHVTVILNKTISSGSVAKHLALFSLRGCLWPLALIVPQLFLLYFQFLHHKKSIMSLRIPSLYFVIETQGPVN